MLSKPISLLLRAFFWCLKIPLGSFRKILQWKHNLLSCLWIQIMPCTIKSQRLAGLPACLPQTSRQFYCFLKAHFIRFPEGHQPLSTSFLDTPSFYYFFRKRKERGLCKVAHLDLSVNFLNSNIKSGCKSPNSPSSNQAMLSGNWRPTSHFKQNKNLEQARLSYCNDLGPGLVCQHDTQGPVCCVRVWTVHHIWKGKVGMPKVWTWGKSTLILACRACFGKKLSIHRQLPEFSSLSSQLSPQPGYSFSWCLPSTKPFHSGAYLELGEHTWDCYAGIWSPAPQPELRWVCWHKQICSYE